MKTTILRIKRFYPVFAGFLLAGLIIMLTGEAAEKLFDFGNLNVRE